MRTNPTTKAMKDVPANDKATTRKSNSAGQASRRRFIKAGGSLISSVTAFSIFPQDVLGGPQNIPPSDKLCIAGIGVGGMGASNLRRLQSENIVALCDVDHKYASRTFERYSNAKTYTDYRKMFDKQKDIDAAVIATPDHTHAVISMAAIQAGKHVYCQKPLTHDVYEARMLSQAAKEARVATQMGNQGHSGDSIRSICEWIWDGAIGDIREVDAWCDLSYYPWGHASWSSKWGTRPTDTPAIPSSLDWNLWIGPAPERPYHPAYHPAVWRCRWDFGCGMMGDRGAHTLDAVVWALKLDAPTSIEATSCGLNPDTHPLSAIVTYQFAARENLPSVKLTWYEGTRPPHPHDLEEEIEWPREGGILFKGSKGKIIAGVYGNNGRLLPKRLDQEYTRPPKTLPRIDCSHEMDWVNACKSGRPAGSEFEYAAHLTEICLLGNIAKRVDARIAWDAENMKVTNRSDSNRYVKTEYRKGWKL